MSNSGTNPYIVNLPCLRCGLERVPVTIFFFGQFRDTISCRACDAEHYLVLRQNNNEFEVVYNRYTRRYPLDSYDDEDDPEYVMMETSAAYTPDLVGGPGPIFVYPRKKNYTLVEILAIWRASKKACHICGRIWKLNERGREGWHIDHIVPHIGGGSDTEQIHNLRVACAKCNLRKGRGYTEKQLRLSIHRLIEFVLDHGDRGLRFWGRLR